MKPPISLKSRSFRRRYDARLVAAALIDDLAAAGNRWADGAAAAVARRYGVAKPADGDDERYFDAIVDGRFGGDGATGAAAVLTDFRAGRLGRVALEGPPVDDDVDAARPPPPAPPAAAPRTPEDADLDRRLREGDFAGW